MAMRDKSTLLILQVAAAFWLILLISDRSSAYELLDTIHTLRAENIHLQYRLDNLTWALRDLKHLILDYSRVHGREFDAEYIHAWRQWSQHGISADTHQTLEQTFCFPNRSPATRPNFITHVLLVLLSPVVCFSTMQL